MFRSNRTGLPGVWTRTGVGELALNVVAVGAIPVLARVMDPLVQALMGWLGYGVLWDELAGRGGHTDIGWEIAASAGLASPVHHGYDTLRALDPLIGMGWLLDLPHVHPPMALAAGIPLSWASYPVWLSCWVVAMVSAMALSMRLMGVPAWVAYPVAVGLGLTGPGQLSLESTYPLMALLIALAWRFRDYPWIAGPSLALFASWRGVGAVMLVYPAIRRRWRTLAIALGVVAALALVAFALEPGVFADFVVKGGAAVQTHLTRPDLFTPEALLSRRGIPRVAVWIVAVCVVAVGLYLKREPFWLLLWFTFAVTPIAWTQSPMMAIPLAVAIWKSGRLGGFLVLVMAIPVVTSGRTPWSLGWITLVVVSAIALLVCDTKAHARRDDVVGSQQ